MIMYWTHLCFFVHASKWLHFGERTHIHDSSTDMQLIVGFYDRRQFAGHPKKISTRFFFALVFVCRALCLFTSIRRAVCDEYISAIYSLDDDLNEWQTVHTPHSRLYDFAVDALKRTRGQNCVLDMQKVGTSLPSTLYIQSICSECLLATAGAGWCRCVAKYPMIFFFAGLCVCCAFILLLVSLFGVSILLSAFALCILCVVSASISLSLLSHRQRWSGRPKVEQLEIFWHLTQDETEQTKTLLTKEKNEAK